MNETRETADTMETRRWIASLWDDAPHAGLDWLEAGYEDPLWFHRSLAAFDIHGPRPPRKSQPGVHYDLYFDLVFSIRGIPALESGSKLRCMHGGMIQVLAPGQVRVNDQ